MALELVKDTDGNWQIADKKYWYKEFATKGYDYKNEYKRLQRYAKHYSDNNIKADVDTDEGKKYLTIQKLIELFDQSNKNIINTFNMRMYDCWYKNEYNNVSFPEFIIRLKQLANVLNRDDTDKADVQHWQELIDLNPQFDWNNENNLYKIIGDYFSKPKAIKLK